MLELLVEFADMIESENVSISVNKEHRTLTIHVPDRQAIQFDTEALRKSAGGIVNDRTAINFLNGQLKK